VTGARSERRRRVCAFHEAGHALAAWRLGSEIILVTIRPSTWPETRLPSEGRVEHRSGRGDHRAFPHHQAIIYFAGPAAQARHDPRSGVRHDATWDHDAAENVARIACRSPASIGPFLRLADHEARALVRAEWHCVEALAETLVARETLSGPEAVAVLAAAATRHELAMQAVRAALAAEGAAAFALIPPDLQAPPARRPRKSVLDSAAATVLQDALRCGGKVSPETLRERILHELRLKGYLRQSCWALVNNFLGIEDSVV
jgi:hypothetical protein